MPASNFECFYLDGFAWVDLLDVLRIPHYSNDRRGDTVARAFKVRTVPLSICPDDPDDEPVSQQVLVVWDLGTPEPTDAEIQVKDAEIQSGRRLDS